MKNYQTKILIVGCTFWLRIDKIVTIVWMEKFTDGRWDILKSSNDYKRLDAYRAQFNVTIPANSKEEISFKARIEKL